MPNLTSGSCSATPISYYGDEISCLSRLVIVIPILGYLEVWRVWGYLATFVAKYRNDRCGTQLKLVNQKIKKQKYLLFIILKRNKLWCEAQQTPPPAATYRMILTC